MDNETIKSLVSLLQAGGSGLLLFGVWAAFRALKTANEAVEAIKQIRDAAVKAEPVLEKIQANTEEAAKVLAEVDKRTAGMETRLVAALAK